MKTFDLFWSPTGQKIAADVSARNARSAVRKAPQPYRKALGEIYATESTMQDSRALDLITLAMSGQDWTPDTLDTISDLVQATGRKIKGV